MSNLTPGGLRCSEFCSLWGHYFDGKITMWRSDKKVFLRVCDTCHQAQARYGNGAWTLLHEFIS